MFLLPFFGFADEYGPALPEAPVEPSIGSGSDIQNKHRVLVALQGRSDIQAELFFDTDSLITGSGVRGSGRILIRDIEFVDFLVWEAHPLSGEAYVFEPVQINIGLADKSIIELKKAPSPFNKISYTTSDGRGFFYSYYYDYFVNGKWKNSGKRDRFPQESVPHEGVLKKIVFVRSQPEKQDGIINLFKSIIK